MTSVSSSSAAYDFVKANVKGGNDFILNMSNYRTSPSTVIGFGNVYEGRPINYYIITDEGTTIKNLPEKIEYNTNIKNYRRIPSTQPTYRSGANRDRFIPFDGIKLEPQYHQGVIHNVKVYEDFLLNRY
jgi:hypothetical protein